MSFCDCHHYVIWWRFMTVLYSKSGLYLLLFSASNCWLGVCHNLTLITNCFKVRASSFQLMLLGRPLLTPPFTESSHNHEGKSGGEMVVVGDVQDLMQICDLSPSLVILIHIRFALNNFCTNMHCIKVWCILFNKFGYSVPKISFCIVYLCFKWVRFSD